MAASIRLTYLLLLFVVVSISFFHYQSDAAKVSALSKSREKSGAESGNGSGEGCGKGSVAASGKGSVAGSVKGSGKGSVAGSGKGSGEGSAAESGEDDDQAMTFLEETCKHTKSYDFCIASLVSDSRSTRTYDLRGLLRISLDLSLSNATHILGYIDNMLDNYATTTSTATLNLTSIESCGQDYDDSLTSIQWAIEAFDGIDGEDYDDANDFIYDAITGTVHCNKEMIDEDMIEVEELPEPLVNMNEIMLKLLHLSQDILCYLSPDSCN